MQTTPEKLVKLLKGDILFIEGDMSLSYSAEEFEKWLIENKIKYNCLFNIEDLSLDYIEQMIYWYDVIVYQTQWATDRSHEIRNLIAKCTRKKLIIECIIGSEASYYVRPKGVIHTMYSLYSWENQPPDEWELHKVKNR